MEKALFIPLKKEHFEDFESGIKTKEFRPYGKRWNEKNCRVGRQVLLSCGYGKYRRLNGIIKSFTKVPAKDSEGRDPFYSIYGTDPDKMVAEIEITLLDLSQLNIKQKIGHRIIELRQAKEISQEELALKAGYDKSHISSIECGKTNTPLQIIYDIACTLGVGLSEFFSGAIFNENSYG
ncbi:helix-turn-helix transcriptional regulator [uncultured Draconibacterium sp.]|uniref:helix-turn-helix domain-containing protein n=1 Tax=uncultured Draconibacterium sp. TaxID=1573823 RepID=UPI0029C84BF9|nr:helix-turn-helix transcriptional regulator [uncultured Draconibacterium sp.]